MATLDELITEAGLRKEVFKSWQIYAFCHPEGGFPILWSPV